MKNILLVEDSKEIFAMVTQAVEAIANISWETTLEGAREALKKEQFDLVLLDIELPDGNGVELCSEIQALNNYTPIFFLTSHKELSEKVLGFSAGADDYITKPFAPLELKARVEAKFKKNDMLKKKSDQLKWREIQINKARQEVHIIHNENELQKIDLTALEFKLLMYFANRPHEVISRDKILDDLWGEDVHVYSRSVDTHVSKLRKKLESVSHIIESIHGSGYKFCPQSI